MVSHSFPTKDVRESRAERDLPEVRGTVLKPVGEPIPATVRLIVPAGGLQLHKYHIEWLRHKKLCIWQCRVADGIVPRVIHTDDPIWLRTQDQAHPLKKSSRWNPALRSGAVCLSGAI